MPSEFETHIRKYLNDNGTVWSSSSIERWAYRAEEEICKKAKIVVDRFSISTVNGISVYSIPSYCLGIRQITWLGYPVAAVSSRQEREFFDSYVISDYGAATGGAFEPSAFYSSAFYTEDLSGYNSFGGSRSRPTNWSYSGYAEDAIQFFPIPNQSVAGTTANLWGSEIGNRVIVECWRLADLSTVSLRPFKRLIRSLVKDYVLSMAYLVEGKGQNTRVAQYYGKRFNSKLSLLQKANEGVYVSRQQQIGAGSSARRRNRLALFGPDFGEIVR